MLLSILYLALFIYVGLLLARRAAPDGSAAVILPLGCGFGVSLLAVLPAVLALALGFTLPAVLLAAAAAICFTLTGQPAYASSPEPSSAVSTSGTEARTCAFVSLPCLYSV